MVQVAEGAMQEVGNILIRFRELGIQASSDTISDIERKMLNKEVVQLREEVDRIANSTEFNGKKLLDGGGSWPTLELQIGIKDDKSSRLEINRQKTNSLLENLGLYGIDFSKKTDAQNFLTDIDSAISTINSHRSTLGAIQNGLQANSGNLLKAQENLMASRSRILDADIASETADAMKEKILAEATGSVLLQANQTPNSALKLL